MADQAGVKGQATRRDFLKATAVAGTAVAANLTMLTNVHAAGDDVVRVGLIGCGGRGTGAADNVLHAAQGVKVVALADVFQDRLEECRHRLRETASTDEKIKSLGNAVDISDDRCFVGFDGYEKLIHCGVNYIILATPPGFRPMMLQAATAAGKNIFTEKPVAVDGPGVRKVLAAYEDAKAKNLAIVAGTQRHHQAGYLETIARIKDGAIGQVTAGRCYWNQGPLWMKPRKPGWSDMEWQLRNWLYFTWLSGDHICEQHIHNLDVMNWILGEHPVAAVGMGGRQVRVGPEYGHIFDHFSIDYEYPHGIHVMSMCRQIDGCKQEVSEAAVGSKGSCYLNANGHFAIKGQSNWSRERKSDVDPYVQEHTDLIESIRAGKPLNELKAVAESTLTAILGRMSAYTGKQVKWEQALESKEDLVPAKLEWSSLPIPPVAVPGKTPLV
jgi:predicted dehydrogenase